MSDYPGHAVGQVVAALKTEGCKLVYGVANLNIKQSKLRFRGDTTAINEMLKGLADCPDATVAVSFQWMDHQSDWHVVHEMRTNTFRFIVNLRSTQIEIEELIIPAAKGPELKR